MYCLITFIAERRSLDKIDKDEFNLWINENDSKIGVWFTPVLSNGTNGDAGLSNYLCSSYGVDLVTEPYELWDKLSQIIIQKFTDESIVDAHILTLWGFRSSIDWTDSGEEYDEEWWLEGEVLDKDLSKLVKNE